MIHQLTLHIHTHSTTTLIFHPSTSIPSLSNNIALTRSTLAVGCNSKSPLRMCSYTAENLKRISPFPTPEPATQRDEEEPHPRRDTEARWVALSMSLGQDDFVGVKMAIRAVSASECLSSRSVFSNRSANVFRNRKIPRTTSRASNSGKEKEIPVGGSSWESEGCCGTRSGGSELVFTDILEYRNCQK